MGLGQYNSLGEYCGPHTTSVSYISISKTMWYHNHARLQYLLGAMSQGAITHLIGIPGTTVIRKKINGDIGR